MDKSIRHIAVDILTKISRDDVFASTLLDQKLDTYKLSQTPDGKLLTHLVYGVLRQKSYLDWIAAQFYKGKYETLDERIKNIFRISFFQFCFSDRLPAFAVVNEAVNIVKHFSPEKNGLVNAVLRNFLRRGKSISFPSFRKQPAEYISVYHSHPLWLVEKWINIFGPDDTMTLCKSNNEHPPLTIRVNTLKTSCENLKGILANDGFECIATEFSPDGLILPHAPVPIQKTKYFLDGLLRLQDEAAQLVSYLVNPKENESIFDACAGSGGKSTHLAALIGNQGGITAADSNHKIIDELKKEAERMGITIIKTVTADLNVSLSGEFREKFDRVLVDAPCSGTGTLRRNPEIKWRLKPNNIQKLTSAQSNILLHASQAVRRGGQLIYCTCSLLPQENENIINHFLDANKSFSVFSPPSTMNQKLFDQRNFYRTYPHIHNMDGFFAAILKKA
ncbi:MAG TPA: 16S rRNA (cytosine(967)-C(5))-methyltransferase RsmB [Deltaproteobacteria bacterium]|nr:16S rRNA (cytosine(967)-C(5))-methyltransferase RsmB [Deltaproteobacteria bacterium]